MPASRAALGRPGWPITEFMHLLYGMVTDVLRPEAAALVADARAAGVRVGALTNDLAAFHGDAGMADDPFIAGLDALVDGSVTGVLKPDPRAYAMAAEALACRRRRSCSSTTCRGTPPPRGTRA